MNRETRVFKDKFTINKIAPVKIIEKNVEKKFVYNRRSVTSNVRELADKVIQRIDDVEKTSMVLKDDVSYDRGLYKYLSMIDSKKRKGCIDEMTKEFLRFTEKFENSVDTNSMNNILELCIECFIYLAFCEESEISNVKEKIRSRVRTLNTRYNDLLLLKNKLRDLDETIKSLKNDYDHFRRLVIETGIILDDSKESLKNMLSGRIQVKGANGNIMKIDTSAAEQEITDLEEVLDSYNDSLDDVKSKILTSESQMNENIIKLNQVTAICFKEFEYSFFMSNFYCGDLDRNLYFWIKN